MCGIAGVIDGSAIGRSDLDTVAGSMTGSLAHRGPDDTGIWTDPDAGVAFGHRRLSIVDLSAAGHQPMVSHDGRYVITFNGEVYGYAVLRAELQARGVSFIGHSDTEVLVESIAERSPNFCAIPTFRRRARSTSTSISLNLAPS